MANTSLKAASVTSQSVIQLPRRGWGEKSGFGVSLSVRSQRTSNSKAYSGFREPRDLPARAAGLRTMALPSGPRPDIHCFPVAVFLQGYAGAAHWKVYIVARGVQPLVICDGTTLSER